MIKASREESFVQKLGHFNVKPWIHTYVVSDQICQTRYAKFYSFLKLKYV